MVDYAPLLPGPATISLTRTCSDGSATTIYQSVNQFQITMTPYQSGAFVVGRSRTTEMLVQAVGPQPAVMVTFNQHWAGEGRVKFRSSSGDYFEQVTLPITAQGVDLVIKGTQTSSAVMDIEIDARIVMNSAAGVFEGIGNTKFFTVASCNIWIEGVAEAVEDTQGAGVPLNNNDSNGNGVRDFESTDSNMGAPDPDLVKYTVDRLSPDDLTGTFQSSVVQSGGGAIGFWDHQNRSGAHFWPGTSYPTDTVNASLAKERWIEGVMQASSAAGTRILGFLVDQGYNKAGVPTVDDAVRLTVFGVDVGTMELDIELTDKNLLFSRGITVHANWDDDDGNGSDDCANGGSGGEEMQNGVEDDELYALKFSSSMGLGVADFSLSIPAGWEAFDSATKANKLTTLSGPITAEGRRFYLEATAVSSQVRDAALSVTTTYLGRSSVMEIRATTGLVMGPQYITQLSRWRYDVKFPASEGNPSVTAQAGAVEVVPGEQRQFALALGNLGIPMRNEISAEFGSGRRLVWKIDVLHLDVDEGNEAAGGDGVDCGTKPSSHEWNGAGSRRHRWAGSPVGSYSAEFDFTATASHPRISNGLPGGDKLLVGIVQNIRVEKLQAAYRGSTDQSVVDGAVLFNETLESGAGAWMWDCLTQSQGDVVGWYGPNAVTTLEAANGAIEVSVTSGDTPSLSVPNLAKGDSPQTREPGDIGSGIPPDGCLAPSNCGSIKHTSTEYQFRVYVAVGLAANVQVHDGSGSQSTALTWNNTQRWCHAAASWRLVVEADHADSGWGWIGDSSGTSGHGNFAGVAEPATSQYSKWSLLNAITPPATGIGPIFNVVFASNPATWADGSWEGR